MRRCREKTHDDSTPIESVATSTLTEVLTSSGESDEHENGRGGRLMPHRTYVPGRSALRSKKSKAKSRRSSVRFTFADDAEGGELVHTTMVTSYRDFDEDHGSRREQADAPDSCKRSDTTSRPAHEEEALPGAAQPPSSDASTIATQGDKQSGSASPSPDRRSRRDDKPRQPQQPQQPQQRVVMGKYMLQMAPEDHMGEGSSSVCWQATDIATGQPVAIKMYKRREKERCGQNVTMRKFCRQVAVLQKLLEPISVPEDRSLWHPDLELVRPHRLFMQLLDYSKDVNGNPGPDPDDGTLYIVTELAQYSLKDYLALRREKGLALPAESVRHISKAIVLVTAGLHAKGFVHMDLKPENLMMFNGRLKLIDVDGCVRIGSSLSILDSSISFSPCYCAPEWARFLLEDDGARLVVSPALDVWSVGVMIAELVTLEPILSEKYSNFLRKCSSQREAGFLFMERLGSLRKPPIPRSVLKFHPGLADLLDNMMLCVGSTARSSLAKCLDTPFLASSSKERRSPTSEGQAGKLASDTTEGNMQDRLLSGQEVSCVSVAEGLAAARLRNRPEDKSMASPLHMGMLWKLNNNGDPKDPAHWLQRDMWIASNGSLCYFSIKENKRLIMIDRQKLATAEITRFSDGVKENAFEIKYHLGEQDVTVSTFFAAESDDSYCLWTAALDQIKKHPAAEETMLTGASFVGELKCFKLSVKNRRMKVTKQDGTPDAAAHRGRLWKLKAAGDRTRAEDWFEREMWLATNGNFVYFSKKESRDLVYYTAADIARATLRKVGDGESFKPWTFQVQMPPSGNVEFAAGEFAAESEEARAAWIEAFRRRSALGAAD